MKKEGRYLKTNTSIGILILRIFIGFRLFYGVIDNVLSWDKMMEFSHFLESNNFPIPLISAIVSVYIQFIGSILILLGYKIKIVSLLLVINFTVAIIAVHIMSNDTIEGMTPAMAMFFGCLTFVFTGAEKISLDNYFNSK